LFSCVNICTGKSLRSFLATAGLLAELQWRTQEAKRLMTH